MQDDGVSTQSEDENSVGDGDSYGSAPDSVIIEKEEVASPSPEVGVNGDENDSSASQAVISGELKNSYFLKNKKKKEKQMGERERQGVRNVKKNRLRIGSAVNDERKTALLVRKKSKNKSRFEFTFP